jgi:hypothetical protein
VSDFSWLYPAAGTICPVCGNRFDPLKVKECGGLLCLTCWSRSSPDFRDQINERLKTVNPYSTVSTQWIRNIYTKKDWT